MAGGKKNRGGANNKKKKKTGSVAGSKSGGGGGGMDVEGGGNGKLAAYMLKKGELAGVSKGNKKKNNKQKAGGKAAQQLNRKRPQLKNIVNLPKPVDSVPADNMKRLLEHKKAHIGDIVEIEIQDSTTFYSAGRDGKLVKWSPAQVTDLGQANSSTATPSSSSTMGGMDMNTPASPAPELKKWVLQEKARMDLGEPIYSMKLISEDTVACGLQGGQIKVFTKDGKNFEWKAHEKRVNALLWHESILISGGNDGHIRCWKFDDGNGSFNEVAAININVPVWSLCVQNGTLWIASQKGLYRLLLQAMMQEKPHKVENTHVGVTGMLPYDNFLIATLRDGTIKCFDATGKEVHNVPAAPDAKSIQAVCGLPEGPRLITGHVEGRLCSFQLPTFSRLAKWNCLQKSNICCLKAVNSNGLFIVGGQEGTVQVWQYDDSDEL